MANINIPITENGTTTLATAGKYCDRNVDIVVNVAGGGGGDIPEEAFNITGDCQYRFAHNGWNWFLENYGSRVTTSNITNASNMFKVSSELKEIPFEINFSTAVNISTLSDVFNSCTFLKTIPHMTGDFSYGNKNAYSSVSSQFYGCQSIREIPQEWLTDIGFANNGQRFYYCRALDSLENVKPTMSTQTSNKYGYFVYACSRLSKFTFALDNGLPCVVNWKSQALDFSQEVGWANYTSYITDYNSGLTTATQVTDDASYQALKNNPDWWTTDVNYSRYNHDSAVETINSLPDTSEYLAANGGTNTIKFKGAAGSLTDSGAINTLTAEEIAVATAKGWTVTLA